MSRKEKRLERFKSGCRDFTWDELCTVLDDLGYEKLSGAGSRYKFRCSASGEIISLHRPHPGNIVKQYAMKAVRTHLKPSGKMK